MDTLALFRRACTIIGPSTTTTTHQGVLSSHQTGCVIGETVHVETRLRGKVLIGGADWGHKFGVPRCPIVHAISLSSHPTWQLRFHGVKSVASDLSFCHIFCSQPFFKAGSSICGCTVPATHFFAIAGAVCQDSKMVQSRLVCAGRRRKGGKGG